MNSSAYQYDAFISYRRQEPDKTFARWLLKELKAAGYRVAFDEVDFSPRATFLNEIERCCQDSRFVLAVISPRYFESGNTDMEATITTVQGMSDRNNRLIPLIYEEVKRPTWMYSLVGVNFTDDDPLVPPLERLKAAMGEPLARNGALQKPSIRVRWQIILDGELSNTFDDTQTVNAIVKQLRELTADSSLTCEEFKNGSIVLTLKGSEEGCRIVESLFTSGNLTEIYGMQIEQVKLLTSPSQPLTSQPLVHSQPPQPKPRLPDLQARLKLMQRLSGLPNPQFEQIVFALQPPAGSMPGAMAPLGDRVAALLNWAESTGGCGLENVKAVLEDILNPR